MAIRGLLVAVLSFSRTLRLEIKNDLQSVELAGDACTLCGTQRRLFEPALLFCSGACGTQIPRNAAYYTDRSKQNFWCKSCHTRTPVNEKLVLQDGKEIRKSDLQSAKNDDIREEPWVQCDDCRSWVHQVCALFNGRSNKTGAAYACPKCVLKNRRRGVEPCTFEKAARDLPRCKMSDAIESGLEKTLQAAYEEKSRSLGISIDEVEKAKELTVRVLCHIEKQHYVRDMVSTSCHLSTAFPFLSLLTAHFLYLPRCMKNIRKLGVQKSFRSGQSVLLFFNLFTASTCSCLQCLSMNMGMIALHQIGGGFIFLIWIPFSILNRNRCEPLHITRY